MLNILTNEVIYNNDLHLYTKNNVALSNVTTLLSKHGLAPDYSGVSSAILSKAADRGKLIHKQIEDYINTGIMGFTDEAKAFADIMAEYEIVPKYSEAIVYNERLAGTIDLIATVKGKESLIDYKTSSVLDLNYVSWQLSVYNYLLDGKFRKLYCYHTLDDKLIEVDLIPRERIEELFTCEKKKMVYCDEYRILTKKKVNDMVRLLSHIKELEKFIEDKENELDNIKADIKMAMEGKKIKSFNNEKVLITYVEGSMRETVNKIKLRKDLKADAEKYITTSQGKSYIRLTWREGK